MAEGAVLKCRDHCTRINYMALSLIVSGVCYSFKLTDHEWSLSGTFKFISVIFRTFSHQRV